MAAGRLEPDIAPDADTLLLQRICERDVDAFEAIYRRYDPRLTPFLTRLLRRPHLVEELKADILMVVWERAHTFTGASRPSTWIFGIAYRQAMKALRRVDDPVADPHEDLRASPESTPEQALGAQHARKLLLDTLTTLSPDHRAVVELTYYQEMGYREIAEVMRCPVDTVKTRMFHARRILKTRLAGELTDWL